VNRPPAFQFYAKDWLSSGKIATMTVEEEGAYIHLLAHCWLSEDCTLPDDDTELAQLSRLGERWLNGASVKLRSCFTAHPRKPGRIFNARLLDERKKQDAWRKKSQDGGRRSAETRTSRSQASRRVVEGSLKGGSRVVEPKVNSSSSSSSSISKNKNTSTKRAHADLLNGHRSSFELFWSHYPRKRNKGAAEKVWSKLQPDDVIMQAMLGKLDQAKQTLDWQKERGQFIPYPASWLNAKGWEDEYDTTSGKERLPL
jgi:uncharacterized protein YdaU (DUF1376 family)